MFWTVLIIVSVITYYFLDWLIRSLKVGNYQDKYVFITGCDSGFGRALAVHLDRLGFHVFAGCLTEDGAKSLSQVCSDRLLTTMLDVRSTASIDGALRVVKNHLPPEKGLWALVNNAGIAGSFACLEVLTKEDVQRVFDVNTLGPFDMTRKFLPLLRKSRGRIVNTASIFGRLAGLGVPYCISKYGVEAMSDLLRRELRGLGLKVSIIEPGAFRTSLLNIGRIVQDVREPFERADQEVQSAYGGDFVDKFEGAFTKIYEVASTSLDPVVDAYTHAITARYPRTRYCVGKDCTFLYVPILYLPDWLADRVLELLRK